MVLQAKKRIAAWKRILDILTLPRIRDDTRRRAGVYAEAADSLLMTRDFEK